MQLSLIDAYRRVVNPATPHSDPNEDTREKTISFFSFFGFLAGIYSCIKWYKAGVEELASGSLVLILGSLTAMCLVKFRVFKPLITANFAVASMATYCGILIFQLGGIHSAHIFWPIGIVIFAYLLTDQKSGVVWFLLTLVYVSLLIMGDLSGYAFPLHELTPQQHKVNMYSGYLLPTLLLWVALAYSQKIRDRALMQVKNSMIQSQAQSRQAEEISDTLSTILEQANTGAQVLLTSADSLSTTVAEMSNHSMEICNGVQEQATASTQINQTLNDMAHSVDASAEGMTQIRNQIQHTERDVTLTASAMQTAIENMARIRESNQGILSAMEVISDIAEQTNLLALNAAIEAARAGDQGRGFAVVADEVRTLSIRSNESAQQIRALLDKASLDVREGNDAVNKAGEVLTGVVTAVQEGASHVNAIADAMLRQRSQINEVVGASNSVEEISQKNAVAGQVLLDRSGGLSSLAQKLSVMAKDMHALVNKGQV